MKNIHRALLIILAALITFVTVFTIITNQNIRSMQGKLDTVSDAQGLILDRLITLDDKLHSETQKEQITALEAEVREYTKKVDGMMMDYMTLDEILQQMFGEAQAVYFKEGRGK